MIPVIYESFLTERRVITLGNQVYPKNGWMVCLAGGSGSGKGHVRDNYLLMDYTTFDVDELKRTFTMAIKRPNSTLKKYATQDDYDSSNPSDVSTLHNIVKTNNWLGKKQDAFMRNIENCPNIVCDVTGDDTNKLINNAKWVRPFGYRTALVWVVSNREEAMIRNVLRKRVVSDTILHTKHNIININMIKFMTTTAGKYYDECWIVFNSNAHAGGTQDELDELNNNRVLKLNKRGNSFVLSNKQLTRILTTLGPNEPNPDNPEVYVNQQTVKDLVKSKGVTNKTAGTTDWGNTKFRK